MYLFKLNKQVGVNHFKEQKHPKVNVYEYDDKVGVVEDELVWIKNQVEVDDGVLTISGDNMVRLTTVEKGYS